MYIGIPPFGQTVRTVTEKVAVLNQVDFYPDGGYLPGYIDIEMNGQSLLSTDFFATDGVKITLVVACNALDEFRSVAYWPVSMVDTYRKAEADARYLNLAGGTLTGGLTAAGNFLMTANSGNARVVGVSNGTNTTLVLQGGGNGAGALGGNIELGRDGNNMYDAAVSRFRSLDGSVTFGQFDVNGLGIGGLPEAGSQLRTYNASGNGKITIETVDAYQSFLNFSAASNEVSIGFVKADNSFRVCQAGDLSSGELLRVDTGGAFKFNSGYGSVATAYGSRAWVNFNGTGTVAIRASGNVSSITDNGTGDYTVNFSSAMPDANYAAVGTCDTNPSQTVQFVSMFVSTISNSTVAPTTAGFRLSTRTSNGAGVDETYINVSIFR